MNRLREAQRAWGLLPVGRRLRVIQALRHEIAANPSRLAELVRRPLHETLNSEVLPLLEACRFLEKRSPAILAPRIERRNRPLWLTGVRLEVHRDPLGIVLVIGPGNYPLFLPAVQALQALAAGNAVVLKPGAGAYDALSYFAILLRSAGLPGNLCLLLDEDPGSAQSVIRSGVDKVVLTGSSETGAVVSRLVADAGIPATMELSGADACIVLADADPQLASRCIQFGLAFNRGNTCIAPRRFYVHESLIAEMRNVLPGQLHLVAFRNAVEAVELANNSPYGLGVSVFGSERTAKEIACRLRCGVVVVNDMIVPTADPRLPFGGRGRSGYGVTRGAEGLLEMTAPKAVTVRRGKFRPHLQPVTPGDAGLFASFIGVLHSNGLVPRARFAGQLLGAMRRRTKHTMDASSEVNS